MFDLEQAISDWPTSGRFYSRGVSVSIRCGLTSRGIKPAARIPACVSGVDPSRAIVLTHCATRSSPR